MRTMRSASVSPETDRGEQVGLQDADARRESGMSSSSSTSGGGATPASTADRRAGAGRSPVSRARGAAAPPCRGPARSRPWAPRGAWNRGRRRCSGPGAAPARRWRPGTTRRPCSSPGRRRHSGSRRSRRRPRWPRRRWSAAAREARSPRRSPRRLRARWRHDVRRARPLLGERERQTGIARRPGLRDVGYPVRREPRGGPEDAPHVGGAVRIE